MNAVFNFSVVIMKSTTVYYGWFLFYFSNDVLPPKMANSLSDIPHFNAMPVYGRQIGVS